MIYIMRQLHFILLLIGFTTGLWSQPYVPMAVDSATWHLASTDENPANDEIIALRIEGDTLVNNILYYKIYHYDFIADGLFSKSRKLLGLLRDDINERKVYGGLLGGVQYGFETFINYNASCVWGDVNNFNEQLLYDFDFELGDTVNVCMLSGPAVITSVDVTDRFGFQRRTFELDNDQHTIMSEGIGTCLGIFEGSFECFFTGGGFAYGLVNYCIGDFSDCSFLTSAKDEAPEEILNVYPNPVSGVLSISNSVEIKQFSLLDIHGKLIEVYSDNTIDFEDQPRGIYFLIGETSDGSRYTTRVIKH